MRQLGIKIGSSAVFFPPEAAPLITHLGGAYAAQQTYRDGKYTGAMLVAAIAGMGGWGR